MLFTTPTFLVFFLVVLALSRVPMGWTGRKLVLLGASYLFYASWNPPFVVLLWISTLVDYIAGRRLAVVTRPGARRAWLAASVVVNLGILAAFKYANFFASVFVEVSGFAGWGIEHSPWSIVLPLGISFYTFQSMSYTIDIYRGKLQPTRNLADFALYVTFFPQLVAGPIVRAGEFLWQLAEPRAATGRQFWWGVLLFNLGMFKKVFLADSVFAPVANAVFTPGPVPTTLQAWAGMYAFAGQIYCDFSGYSDMAIAAALMLGFRLPDNFRAPYAAVGFSDFWRRWHISLSSWLRDYLYIPLGGNRKGRLRTRLNLLITMLLGGLWHGAAWTFVFWGALHGMYLGAERLAKQVFKGREFKGLPVRLLLMLLTFHCVCLGWVLFRAEGLGHALDVLASLAHVKPGAGLLEFSRWAAVVALASICGLLLMHWLHRESSIEATSARVGWLVTALASGVILFLSLTTEESGVEFIYFQF